MIIRLLIVLVLVWTALGFAAYAVYAALVPLAGAAGAAALTALACLALAAILGWIASRRFVAFKAERIDPVMHSVRRAGILGGQIARAPIRYPASSAGLAAGGVSIVVLLRYLRRVLGRMFGGARL